MSFKIQVLRIEYLIVQAIFDLVFELASSYLNLEFNWDGYKTYKDYFEFLKKAFPSSLNFCQVTSSDDDS